MTPRSGAGPARRAATAYLRAVNAVLDAGARSEHAAALFTLTCGVP